ncbi:pentatricopeptide repeat-containing protein At1g59720, chloroplastic/mitochondrial [Magnolia sinica]|uniref:pentatricopeptide repeat-containing protein At1g59720, chloroplastic/mitochondrial n=1 Tax=Magnolia sinica TaxID=86752 RepID=UPI0026581668|nr:pentatricopeptide repeat-containing protein At1g59720, chloroplastic/mitochondrial [Magnolia sinica]
MTSLAFVATSQPFITTPPHSPSPPPPPPPSSHHNRHLLSLLTDNISMPHLKQIHAQFLKTSSPPLPHLPLDYHTLFLYSRILHSSAALDLHYADRLLSAIPNPNSFIWNTLIRAYARSPDLKLRSLVLYHRMVADGRAAPDKYTFPFVLKACAFLFAVWEGRQIHARIVKLGFTCDTHVNNSLIHFYASCGCLDASRRVFDGMPERSLVSWNVVIDGYVHWGEFVVAIGLFREMQGLSFEPDGFTMQSIVCACAGLGAFSLGLWSHAYVLRNCQQEVADDVLMNNCLLDMYTKCGAIYMAVQLFGCMPKRDVTSWNAMIIGFAMHGHVKESFDAFGCMCTKERLKPSSITFVGVLSACNHGGLVNEGQRYFDSMVTEYGIAPQIEHYGCMVDLFARAGLVYEALNLVSGMPMKPDVVIWRSLLDACCKLNAGIEVSELVAKRVLKSEGGMSSGTYVLLSRVYASANQWNEVGLVRKLMSEKGITKEPGCSLIEMDGVVHEFIAGDTSHPRSQEIYEMLEAIEEKLVSVGYTPDLSQAHIADHADEKRHSLRLHSERLAIAFGLLNAKPGTPIRILKNLRVCSDCHTLTKLISTVFDVEIIVRDRTRFHRFKAGLCSCMDYW